jgi:hypothetical protein
MKKMKSRIHVLMLWCAVFGMGAGALAATMVWPQQPSRAWSDPNAIWQTTTGGVTVPPGPADYAYVLSTNEVTVNSSVNIRRLYIDRTASATFPAVASTVTVVPGGVLKANSIIQLGVDISGGTLNVAGGEVDFSADDRGGTWSLRLDNAAANVNITAGKLKIGNGSSNTQVLSNSASTSTVITVSGSGSLEMLNGAAFVFTVGNPLVRLSDGGILKYVGTNAISAISALAGAGKLEGVSPLSPPPFVPMGTSNGVGWYYSGTDTYVFAVAGPSVDIGSNQMVWLADAAAGLQMTSQILNFDPGETYTYTWSGAGVTFDDGFGGDGTHAPNPIAIFSGGGVYTVTLQVSNSLGVGGALKTVTVLDPAVTNKQIGRWAMDEDSGTVVNDSAADGFNNQGKIVGAADWRAGWVGSGSLYFNGGTTVDVLADPNGLNAIKYGATLSAWMKADVPGLTQYILDKPNAFNLRLLPTTGGIRVRFFGTSNQYLDFAEKRFDDGNWYHVAATYDAIAGQANLYVNGLLVTSQSSTGLMAASEPNMILGSAWQGGLDEVAVYSYALTDSDVRALAGMGDTVPFVGAGQDQFYQINPSFPLKLQGSIYDLDSTPVTAWSVSVGNPASVTFVDASDPTTEVYFNPADPGVFTLRLSATDTVGGQPVVVYDDVVITTNAPTCADVVASGLTHPLDVSGPVAGQPDCYINLYDLAYFAQSWLDCNDPENPACDWPWL